MPFLLYLIPFAIIATILAAIPAPPTPAASDHEAFAVAIALTEAHQAALTYAAKLPAATGPIPSTGSPSLTTYLPPGWTAPNGITIAACIGSQAEHRAVATWTTTTTPPPSRVAQALAAQSGNTSDAGQINVHPTIPAQVVPLAATTTYIFPSTSCPMPTTTSAVLVTHTLP